jgi:hypothetical protein
MNVQSKTVGFVHWEATKFKLIIWSVASIFMNIYVQSLYIMDITTMNIIQMMRYNYRVILRAN